MLTVVPELTPGSAPDERGQSLGEALDGLLEFTGATAGWVSLVEPGGRLVFPARRGNLSDAWLTLQTAQGGPWGFEVREGPTLLNDLRPLASLGNPPLANLLSCPLGDASARRGQVILVNKANGFTSNDAAALQAVAHLMLKEVDRAEARRKPCPELPPALLGRILDQLPQGVLVVDNNGMLAFANATWLSWTGLRAEEVVGALAPYPFWVSHRELAAAIRPEEFPVDARPFRHRDGSLFWCRVATKSEEYKGRRVTAAFLQKLPVPQPTTTPQRVVPSAAAENLPFATVLTDGSGRIQWANSALERVAPLMSGSGPLLRDRFATPASAALERLFRDPERTEPGQAGRLHLQTTGGKDVLALWLAVGRPERPAFLFAVTDDREGIPLSEDQPRTDQRAAEPPATSWLALLVQRGTEVAFWDQRWEGLTGLPTAEVRGAASEVVLDWLFPRQRDRDQVADWLHQPAARGRQAVLEVQTRAGGRPLLCTFLPVNSSARIGARRWLLLLGEPALLSGGAGPSLNFIRQVTRGLSRLLNHYLTVPVGLAEIALDKESLPPETANWFTQILESCQRATRLIAALEDLSTESLGDTVLMPLADLVRPLLDERAAALPESPYQLAVDPRDAQAPVRVNRRLLRVVLQHLLSNAEQAVVGKARPRIEVRVFAGDQEVRCEIRDNGEGLPTDDPTLPMAPFFSTKGPFARDPAHAAQEATGLGLTVSQRLLLLHGGNLELRANPEGGTTATIILPRGDLSPTSEGTAALGPESVRGDVPESAQGPHGKEEWSGARPRPEE
jgi:PAS domain S-box-containing protein